MGTARTPFPARLVAAALLVGACTTEPPPPPTLGAEGSLGAPQLPSPLPLRGASPAAPRLPAELPMTPSAAGTAEGALATVLLGAGGAVLAGAVATVYCAPLGILAVLCAPVGAGAGMVGGGQAGANAVARSRAERHDAQARAAFQAFAERLDGARLAECLERTLLERSGGRLVPAAPDAPVALETRLVLLQVQQAEGRAAGQLGLSLAVAASIQGPGATGGARVFTWQGPPRPSSDWIAEPATALDADLQAAIGLVAQRLLSDLFPEAIAAPPADAPAAAYRASCARPA